jgi:tRNA-dihydrouridine synthase A
VHARTALLKGLNARQNRNIPPLRYEDVYRLKSQFPELMFEINGGIKNFQSAEKHINFVDSVMIGRAAHENPFMFSTADSRFFQDDDLGLNRREIIDRMVRYIQTWEGSGIKPYQILKHLRGLLNGKPGSKVWKRTIGTFSKYGEIPAQEILKQVEQIPAEILEERPHSVPDAHAVFN